MKLVISTYNKMSLPSSVDLQDQGRTRKDEGHGIVCIMTAFACCMSLLTKENFLGNRSTPVEAVPEKNVCAEEKNSVSNPFYNLLTVTMRTFIARWRQRNKWLLEKKEKY